MDGHVTQVDLAHAIQVDVSWGYRKSGPLDFNQRACVTGAALWSLKMKLTQGMAERRAINKTAVDDIEFLK